MGKIVQGRLIADGVMKRGDVLMPSEKHHHSPTTWWTRARIRRLLKLMQAAYPQATCALHYRDPYELLVATILSAQCTDERVNQVTPAFFRRYPDAFHLAQAEPAEVEALIRSTGFYRAKAKNLLGMARALVQDHAGEVPRQLESLVKLPGVGRKTANVVLGTAYGIPAGVVVDTHVSRLARRLGLTHATQPERIEQDLMALLPQDSWIDFSHRLIHHGRRVCSARKPRCDECPLAPICLKIGVSAAPSGRRTSHPTAQLLHRRSRRNVSSQEVN